MSIFLDTEGLGSLGIGICGRCSRKFPIGSLYPDPNSPGLLVCEDDLDQYDPYRLPPRESEVITLEFARPDIALTVPITVPVREIRVTEVSDPRITEDSNPRVTEDSE